ncbi:MAG: hypothetical protein RBR74_09080, partial [Ignavibacteriaceae bacterium]|nr:hypothetical protein [Ignavibacteriaceae bacterium]
LGGKPASEYLVKNDSTAQRTFSDLKYVDKASTQTITGNKTFSNKIVVGSGNNILSYDNLTLMQDGSFPNFNLKINEPIISADVWSMTFDYTGLLTLLGKGFYIGLPSGNLSYIGGTVNSSDLNWLIERKYAIYSMNGLRTDGDIYVDSGDIYVNGDINVIGNYYRNGVPITASGSVGNADSLGALPASAYVTKSAIDGWSTNLYTGSANVMRLGKNYNDKRFNNGAYSDIWNIDYVIPPYNLSADWLYSIEHRTDYFNDTLNTIAHSDIVNIDGTGTPIWKTNDVRIMGNEIAVNVGDLPDSVALNWSLAGLTGNKVILSEANKTAVESRFPMPVRGFEFKFGSVPNYIFPRVYSFFSDLTTNTPSLETAYHFYGKGDYPSYFGGNIYTDGYLRVQDSIIIGTSTVKIYPDSVLVGGVRLAKITEAGGLDTSVVNALIEANEDSSGQSIIGTTATLDSIIMDYWNDNLGGSTWDSTYAYQRITALESTVTSLQNSINNILAALDTCGCSASTADNTPPLAPTSYVAIGGTSQTQYVSTWTDPTATDLDSIRWYEGSTNDSTALNWIASIPAGTETYTRTGRTANTTYWSAVKAVDDSGNVSYFSNLDSATTQATSGAIPFATLDFEEGNLSEWSSTSGANLSASTTFAHGGTYSMRVGTNSLGFYDFTATDTVWATFWVYLPSTSSQSATTNYIAMFNNGIADRTCFGTNNSTWSEWIVGVNSGDLTDGDFTTNFSQDTWHKIKIKYETNGTTTSYHQVWVDGTSIWSATNTFTNTVSNFTAGSETATITNYFYVDDINLYLTDPDL